MNRSIKISTFFLNFGTKLERDFQSENFRNWDEAKKYLVERIQIKRDREIFKMALEVEGFTKHFSEMNNKNFNSLILIEREFNRILEEFKEEEKVNSEKNDEKFNGKKSRIEIRIDSLEKEKALKKAKKAGLNISEYTRQLYEYGEVVVVSDQTKRDVRGMAINLNQIAKRINSGSISSSTVIYELQQILEEINKTYRR
jgi:predicted DNA binding CopG/RHH family protein